MFDAKRRSERERFLLQAHVRMEIPLSCLHRFVPQPERDHRAVHAVVKKVHGCGVPTDVRANFLPFEGRATPLGQMGVFDEEALNRITAESAAADAGKDWILGLTVAFV